jgi:hypothetical protein
MPEGKFPLEDVVITRHAQDEVHPDDVLTCLARHVRGDWGDACVVAIFRTATSESQYFCLCRNYRRLTRKSGRNITSAGFW